MTQGRAVLGRSYDNQDCSIARTLEVVGERWSLLIIRDALFAGHTRFGQFLRSLGIASNILSSRLDAFVKAGVFTVEPREGGQQNEYHLTEKGRALAPVLAAMIKWGDDWAAPDGPPGRLTHKGCGGSLNQDLVCDCCGGAVECSDVGVVSNRAAPEVPAK